MILEAQRRAVVSYGLAMVRTGLTTGTGGNLSCCDQNRGRIAISPSGVPYDVLRPQDVVVVDPDGNIVQYDWDFDDGSTGSGLFVTHTYTAPGAYTATLTVTDDNGASGSTARTVEVSATGNGIAFVGKAGAARNASSLAVAVPSGVSPYDGLLLFATVNSG